MAKKLEIYGFNKKKTLLHILICLDKYRCLLFCWIYKLSETQ
jgi:hypothetical protein